MKVSVLVLTVLFATSVFGTPLTEIRYETTNLGSNHWQYTYDITNISLTENIEEFTIWFDYGKYDNLTITTPNPLASNWDELVVQPEPILKDDGFYDALALTSGIAIGQTVSGFSVSFDWSGVGEPSYQFYEAIDPITFETIESGYTVLIPEPISCILLVCGTLLIGQRRKQ